jgi:exodeoxyribonuclease VII large subunit
MQPENILRKGFALVKAEGRIISNSEEIQIGQQVEIILSDTQLDATIHSKKTYYGNEFDL